MTALPARRPSGRHALLPEHKGAGPLGEPPAHLSKAQAGIWSEVRALGPHLVERDRLAVETLVAAIDLARRAQRTINREGIAVITPTGGKAVHPSATLLGLQLVTIRALQSDLGLSPAGRARHGVRAVDPRLDLWAEERVRSPR